jgi:hypothetical protein
MLLARRHNAPAIWSTRLTLPANTIIRRVRTRCFIEHSRGNGSTPKRDVTKSRASVWRRVGVKREHPAAATLLTNDPRRALQSDALRATTLYLAPRRIPRTLKIFRRSKVADPVGSGHVAAMRIDGEAPGRQAHSQKRHRSQQIHRVAATSDRYRRFVMQSRRASKLFALAIRCPQS